VPLSIQSRTVGDVVVLGCAGRLVEGAETNELDRQVRDFTQMLHREFVLDLRNVSFIDSAGLGLLVRLVSRVRAAGGELKLCAVPLHIQKTLRVTRLQQVLASYENEAEAIVAMCGTDARGKAAAPDPVDILCVHSSSDVLAYLQQLLRQAGYAAMTTTNRSDASTLLRATTPGILVVDAATAAAWGGAAVLTKVLPGDVQVIELPETFATQDPAVAGQQLLAEIARAAVARR
jgi:anti-sigma B factor antagonist